MASLFGVTIDRLKTEIQSDEKQTIALCYTDHLLRRFGLAELIEPMSDESGQLRMRPEADEIWAILKGSITLELFDHRSESPTHGQSQSIKMDAPARVLIPFGVAVGWKSTTEPVEVLRLATHSIEESAVEFIPWKEA